ncbi:phosphate acetyltransferase [Corynebacterium sp. HMSC08D02]|uniref:phosphate acetyltransferase n=1 Tax=Corynebacterium sp. HMSC08D02 TaxID=1581138 RepID=UPI0008A1D380|nr:phosphate acetyltransferase [Corynebacterium sp. HMSC08D02]OFT30329.1 phosphate acetyltransferase [Corynebacterium sp. HMSC08D02]
MAQHLLLTCTNTNLGSADADALAAQHGLQTIHVTGETLAEAYATCADQEQGTLFVGQGECSFDAELAAALGAAVIVLIDAPQRAPLAQRIVERHGATLLATVTDVEEAAGLTIPEVAPVMSPLVFGSRLLGQAREVGAHIVLPEGEDARVLEAAHRLLEGGVAKLTLLGDVDAITAKARELELDVSAATLLDHRTSDLAEEFAQTFAELRKSKGVTLEQARETMQDVSYFATMLVHTGRADGMVSGAVHTTAETIKPAFQIIKTRPEASVVSSIFLMVMQGRLWAFGDCAVNPNPSAQQLGEIAVSSALTAAQFGIEPKVAVLSYATGSSGAGPDVERAVKAVATARAINSDLIIDGPLQFDAACDGGVAKQKAPDSPVAGQANVFIFPDLEAGNAGYKIAQRTGGALAVGPILQGLNKPVNDLSRGATVDDIVNTVAVTAIQAGVK